MNDLCATNTREHKAITDAQSDLYDKMDNGKTEMYQALNNRPRWNVIMWLIGGIFAAIVFVAGMTYNVECMVDDHIVAGQEAWIIDHPGEPPIDLRGGD